MASEPPPSASIVLSPAFNLRCASALAADQSSISSRYRSHTQFTHPLIQQLSGSVGCGGTSTPAMYVDAFLRSAARAANSAGPSSRDPKTRRALSNGVGSVGVIVVEKVSVEAEELDSVFCDAEEPESVLRGRPGLRFGFGVVVSDGVSLLGTCFFPGGRTSGSAEFGGSSGLTSGIKGGDFRRFS